MRGLSFLLVAFSVLFFPKYIFAAIQFSIDSPQINNNEITVSYSASGLTSSSCPIENKCFVFAVLTHPDYTRYFGQTQNNQGDWINYQSSPEPEYIQSNFLYFQPISGSHSGQIKIKFLASDSEYKGPENYKLMVRRYTGKSSSVAGDSNQLTVFLSLPTPTAASPTPTPTSAPTTIPIITTPTPTPTQVPTKLTTPSPSATISGDVLGKSEEVSTVESELDLSPTPTPTPTITPHNNQFSIRLGIALIIIGGGGLLLRLKYTSWLQALKDGFRRLSGS